MLCISVVEPPKVTLSGSGSDVVYTLTCTVALPTGVQLDNSVPPNVQWLGPDMTILTPMEYSQSSSGIYVSNVTLNPLNETHSGQYSCRASYSLGNISSEVVTDKKTVIVIVKRGMVISVISELSNLFVHVYLMSVTFLSHAALSAPGVTVRDEGSAVAGSNYSLFCEVTIPPFSDTISVSKPYIEWTLPFGEIKSGIIDKNQLSFSPLTIDDEGVYTCTAHYFVNGISSPAASSFYNVFISKYMHMQVCYLEFVLQVCANNIIMIVVISFRTS